MRGKDTERERNGNGTNTERIQNGNGSKNEEKKRSLERKHETMTCGVFSVDKGHQETREDVLIYCTSYPYFLQKCKCLLRLSWNTSPYMKLLKCNHAKLYAQAINWKDLFARNASIRVYHGHFEIDNKSRLWPNKEMYGRVELEWN